MNKPLFRVKSVTIPYPKQGTLLLFCLGFFSLWLGFPNAFVTCPPLVLFWPLSLVLFGLRASSAKEAFFAALATNFCGMILTLYWLALPIRLVGEMPWIVAGACALLVSFALAAILALESVFAYYAKCLPLVLFPISTALFWALLEEANALLAGFPWLPLGAALVVWPVFVQQAAYCGMYGTSFLWLLALFLGIPIFYQKRLGLPLLCLGVFLIAVLLFHGHATLSREPFEANPTDSTSFGVLFIEGNYDQNQKWVPSLQRETVLRYAQLTKEGLSDA
ncbi:MAG: apolipoprotein N-acyltransferase, partial [Desulfovibrio sp.]|nr:apolipoprotein N-acyltransferase [Desulfovibrio sp.]